MGYQQVELTRPADFAPKEHTSASQIGQFAGCQRQWAFRKLVGLREVKPRPWLEFGHEVEHYIQKYLEGYAIPQDIEAGRRALAGLHLLPDPKICEEIVHQETICIDSTLVAPHLERIQIEGAKDLVTHTDHWHLYDYKTTRGNTRRKGGEWDYVKTKEQLLSDVQANLYAWDMFQWRDILELPARWIYLLTDQKKHPDARATDVVFTYEETRNRVAKFLELADQHRYLVRAYKHSPFDVNTLPGNADQCETFGGCPYRPAVGGPCKQPSRSLGAMLKMNPNGLPPMPIEDFLAQKRAEGLAAGAPPGYPSASAQPPSQGLMAPPAAPVPVPQIPTYQVGQVINGHQFDGQRWNPVQAPQMAPPAPHLPPEAYQPPMPSPMAAPVQAPAWAPPAPGLPGGVAPVAAAPAKRGRPRKSPMGQELPVASPGTTEEPAEETDDRAQFMRACVLAVSGDVAIQDPARVDAMAKLAVQYASLVWQYLSHAGA